MNLTRNTASAISGILNQVKINKVAYKGEKKVLFDSFLAVHKVAKEIAEDAETIRKKFNDDWKDEFPTVLKLRESGIPVEGHDECLKAEADANETLRSLGEDEVELDIEPALRECLQDPDLWGEDETLGQIAAKLDFLQSNGILKA